MTFAQGRYRLMTHFSERIPVVKRRITVIFNRYYTLPITYHYINSHKDTCFRSEWYSFTDFRPNNLCNRCVQLSGVAGRNYSGLIVYTKAAHSIHVPQSVLETQLIRKDKKCLLLILHERLSNLHAFFIGNFSNKFSLLNKKRIFQML